MLKKRGFLQARWLRTCHTYYQADFAERGLLNHRLGRTKDTGRRASSRSRIILDSLRRFFSYLSLCGQVKIFFISSIRLISELRISVRFLHVNQDLESGCFVGDLLCEDSYKGESQRVFAISKWRNSFSFNYKLSSWKIFFNAKWFIIVWKRSNWEIV